MFELIEKGGHLMWLLLGCSVMSLFIVLERTFHFHRSTINVEDFLQGLANLIRRKSFGEAIHQCSATPGPVARVIRAAVIRNDYPRSELKQIVEETGQLEVPRLERYLPVLLTIAYSAPLIGMLGTLIGLIDTFGELNAASGFSTPAALASGVYTSLITSATGLVVAIPSFVLYSYLAARTKSLMHDMERGGVEIVNIIEDYRKSNDFIQFDSSASLKDTKESDAKQG